MRYRRLGHWGVSVSEITLGTWLTHGGRAGEEQAIDCTRRAHALGITLFDTANVYPEHDKGAAEQVLGRALAALQRDTFLVATKVFSPMGDSPLQRGLSRHHIMTQIDGSLRRLGMDYIDLYQCHRYDPQTPLEETATAMSDLVRRGKILYWGVSDWPAEHITRVVELCRRHGWAPPVSNQPYYSLLRRDGEQTVFPVCESAGLGILAYAPLEHGALTGKYRPEATSPAGTRAAGPGSWMFDQHFTPEVLTAVQKLHRLADESGYTASQLVIAWCLRHRAVTSVIVGASRLAQLEENVAAIDNPVDDGILDAAAQLLDPVRLT